MKTVAILIPALNPDRRLIAYVQNLITYGFHKILIIDDGSNEEAKSIFSDIASFGGEETDITILEHAVNLGIGDPQDNDVGYRGWMSKYVLYSNDVTMINQQNIDTMKNFRDYDYLIILERDDFVNSFLTDLGLTTEEDCIKVSDYLIETP